MRKTLSLLLGFWGYEKQGLAETIAWATHEEPVISDAPARAQQSATYMGHLCTFLYLGNFNPETLIGIAFFYGGAAAIDFVTSRRLKAKIESLLETTVEAAVDTDPELLSGHVEPPNVVEATSYTIV